MKAICKFIANSITDISRYRCVTREKNIPRNINDFYTLDSTQFHSELNTLHRVKEKRYGKRRSSKTSSAMRLKWFHKWRCKINENKSSHIIFTLRKQSCPQVTINNIPIPNKDSVRYLGTILARGMTWKRHIVDKSEELKSKFKK